MINYSINDVEVKKGLNKLIKKNPELSRRVLSYISEAVVNRSVEHHLSGQTLKRQTGTLAKSINYKMQGNYKSKVGTNVTYAAIHEFGGTIKPKNGKALAFKIKDSWAVVKEVKIPKRSFLAPALEYVMTHEAARIMDKQATIWLGKVWYK